MKDIPWAENLEQTLATMQKHGLLLVSCDAEGRPNVMTIGWATFGIVWGRPVMVTLVRPSRFTFGNLEAVGEFVVAVPSEQMHEACMLCGTRSGRDTDKFAEAGLTPVPARHVRPPLIAQCVRHYECRVLHRNDIVDAALAPEVRTEAYPQGDLHRLYYGQILRACERA